MPYQETQSPVSGYVIGWGHTSQGEIYQQVWRPKDNINQKFLLAGKRLSLPSPSIQYTYLAKDERFWVKEGDIYGKYFHLCYADILRHYVLVLKIKNNKG